MRRRVWVVAVTVVLVGVLFVAVFPTRTFLAQRASVNAAQAQLEVLGEQNRLLEDRARLLNDDAEIERLAREQYHLVKPGEKAYALIPPPAPPTPPPLVGTPPEQLTGRNLLQMTWEWLTDRF